MRHIVDEDEIKMKYYCILAIRKTNPTDILGYVEHSFHMGWSSDRVNLYCNGSDFTGHTASEEWKSRLDDDTCRNGNTLPEKYKGRMQYLRKIYIRRQFEPCGRTPDELEWKYVKWRAETSVGRELKKRGYEIKAFRVNSKHCPVKIDLSERDLMNRRKITFDKFRYRNARFKAL